MGVPESAALASRCEYRGERKEAEDEQVLFVHDGEDTDEADRECVQRETRVDEGEF